MVPDALEARIGEGIVRRRLAVTPLSHDFVSRRRIHRVGGEIAESAGFQVDEPAIYLIVDAMRNAWAVPGNHLFITTGLLEFIGGDDDLLAAALAHEIAHIRARHVIKKLEAIVAVTEIVGAAHMGTRSGSYKSTHHSVRETAL